MVPHSEDVHAGSVATVRTQLLSVLMIDDASRRDQLGVGHEPALRTLPSYCPQLNVIEQFWWKFRWTTRNQ